MYSSGSFLNLALCWGRFLSRGCPILHPPQFWRTSGLSSTLLSHACTPRPSPAAFRSRASTTTAAAAAAAAAVADGLEEKRGEAADAVG